VKVLVVCEGKHESGGALESLLRRMGPGADVQYDWDKLSKASLHAHHGKGQGYHKRAVAWMRDAEKRGYDGLILLVDRDSQPPREADIDRAQSDTTSAIQRALGVAIEMFDAWILADECALTEVLGVEVSRQADPETVRDPKSKVEALLRLSPRGLAATEMYAGVAKIADLAILEARCPRGFRPFAARVRSLCSVAS
jgi:hypothetical protein